MARPGLLLPPRALLLSLVAQIPLVAVFWPPSPKASMMVAGSACLFAGVVLNVWAERLFRRHDVGVCPFTPVAGLIRSGPYRVTRNPMYLGMILLTGGVALVTGLPLNLWSPAVYAVWLHRRFVLPEEDYLRRQLGSAYEDYVDNHPRWLGVPLPPKALEA